MAVAAVLGLGARDVALGLVLHDWQSDPVRSTWTETQQLVGVAIIVVMSVLASIFVAIHAEHQRMKEVEQDAREAEETTSSRERGREQ